METLSEHLLSRGMVVSKYSVALDETERTSTFYLHNFSGQITGYQIYRPDSTVKKVNDEELSRYYTYLPKGVDGVFGLEQLDPSKRTVYIVEGIFKAANLHRLGYNSIAVLTSHPKRLRSWFRILGSVWNLVGIGDNDLAGLKLVDTVEKGFQSPVDVDEMEDDEIHMMLSRTI